MTPEDAPACQGQNVIGFQSEMEDSLNYFLVPEVNPYGIQKLVFTHTKRDSKEIDISLNHDHSVLMYVEGNSNVITDEDIDNNEYELNAVDVYIYSDKTIMMLENCMYYFGIFTNVNIVDFNNMINTSNVADMSCMFESLGYNNLTTLNLGSKFTKIALSNENMFNDTGKEGCEIQVPAAIYQDEHNFKLGDGSTTTINYTRGTIKKVYN